MKKHAVITIVAHVDAGKTTLSESLLYLTGTIRKAGRVDHKDSFMDTNELEKERGITIFSSQAEIETENLHLTLLDTPGHIDFSAETERTLSVPDYAILVINAFDSVQGHTEILADLLNKYNIPVFIFVNKTDMPGFDKNKILSEIQKYIYPNAIDFTDDTSEDFFESIALCDENTMNKYTENEKINIKDIQLLIAKRKIMPCMFGSALKMTGIKEFINILEKYILEKKYPEEFGARIFRITHDENGNRLTHMKITGGSLKVRSMINDEKVTGIRIYSGTKFKTCDEAFAGDIVSVTGLTKTRAGEGLGYETDKYNAVLKPVLTYKMNIPSEYSVNEIIDKFKILEEEDPLLSIEWNEKAREIDVRVMGEVQLEILQKIIAERFGINVTFGEGKILYKETISDRVLGVGHYEPLRHYAEVHLILEPSDQDGITFVSKCSTDMLALNWQRLIETHVYEKQHKGVLTGSPITGIKITLVAGRASVKHTVGGDFRQATYRAIRNGLRKAKSILLEPYYSFRLEIPTENTGRAMSDLTAMKAEFEQPEIENNMSIIKGNIPVSTLRGYTADIRSYTKGRGKIFCTLAGYGPCHNSEEVIKEIGYDPDADIWNTADSVFCSGGAGHVVPWNEVEEHMHIESEFGKDINAESFAKAATEKNKISSKEYEAELKAIFEREFGKGKQVPQNEERVHGSGFDTLDNYVYKEKKAPQECLLVDGYNIIWAWDELRQIAEYSFEAARHRLLEILSDYQAVRKCILIVVFDAYKVLNNPGSESKYHNIYVVFTKTAETADMYIEKTTHEIAKKYRVRVATSDGMEQVIILGRGAARISAREFHDEVFSQHEEIKKQYAGKESLHKDYLLYHMNDEILNIGRKEEDKK